MEVKTFYISINNNDYTLYCIEDKTKIGLSHKASIGSCFMKLNYIGKIKEKFKFESVIIQLLKNIFKREEYGEIIYPKNLNDILNKIIKNDESNTNLIY